MSDCYIWEGSAARAVMRDCASLGALDSYEIEVCRKLRQADTDSAIAIGFFDIDSVRYAKPVDNLTSEKLLQTFIRQELCGAPEFCEFIKSHLDELVFEITLASERPHSSIWFVRLLIDKSTHQLMGKMFIESPAKSSHFSELRPSA